MQIDASIIQYCVEECKGEGNEKRIYMNKKDNSWYFMVEIQMNYWYSNYYRLCPRHHFNGVHDKNTGKLLAQTSEKRRNTLPNIDCF